MSSMSTEAFVALVQSVRDCPGIVRGMIATHRESGGEVPRDIAWRYEPLSVLDEMAEMFSWLDRGGAA